MFKPGSTNIAREGGLTYIDCFSIRVAWLENRVAIRFQDREMTYAELNLRANRLAWYLRALGVGPEVLVAVCLDRSLELLVALLAIWKAGGAFLPVDPDYPPDRLAYLLADSQAPILLTDSRLRSRFEKCQTQTVAIDKLPNLNQFPGEDPCPAATADQLAYVLYTSGSTGMPKGVEITHRALLNHNLVISQAYQLCSEDRVLQFASLSFDVALEEIFPTWLCGGSLVLRPKDLISSTKEFLHFVERERISVLNLPTAYWHELISDLQPGTWPTSVRLVIIGGERASEHAFRRWKEIVPAEVKLINAYGLTEATITSALFESDRIRERLPIGKAITNSYAVVLDEHLQPVPAGHLGELYLGGVGLARGYLHRPELTAERFIANPLPELIPSDRLYRTGDLARFDSDGNLELAGRMDSQVKIRGFRVEPGEIETALHDCPWIKEVVVTAREDRPGHNHLVAYFVPHPKQSPSVTQLMAFLRDKVPAHMIPSTFISLGALPKTPGGKVDKRALPQPNDTRPLLAGERIQPQSRVEADLTGIWEEVLRVKNIGVRDDFFELGGDSLLALQILSRIRDRFGVELGLSQFFDEPKIAALAAVIDGGGPPEDVLSHPAPNSAPCHGPPPASLMQQQLFFMHEMEPSSDAYHIACAFRLRGPLNVNVFEQALNKVIERHEMLRTRLDYAEGKLCQFVAPHLQVLVAITSLAHVFRRNRPIELQQRLRMEVQRPFQLDALPLFRVSLVRFTRTYHVLLMVIHHCIADGWSIGILLRELQQAYADLMAGSVSSQLPDLRTHYADFVHYQDRLLNGPGLRAHLEFWKKTLAGAPHAVVWPETPPQKATDKRIAERSTITLSKRTVTTSTKALRTKHLTPFMALLGATALSLWDWTQQTDMVIGTVIAGRTRKEFENVIGCFMNFLPLRLQLQLDRTVSEFLGQIRRTVLDAQSRQECPFEHIVRAVDGLPKSAHNPLFNVALLYHNYPAGSFAPPGIRAESLPLPPRNPLLDLRIEAEPRGPQWAIDFEFDPILLSQESITRLAQAFERAFEFLIQMPTTPLEEFTYYKAKAKPRRLWFLPGRRAVTCHCVNIEN